MEMMNGTKHCQCSESYFGPQCEQNKCEYCGTGKCEVLGSGITCKYVPAHSTHCFHSLPALSLSLFEIRSHINMDQLCAVYVGTMIIYVLLCRCDNNIQRPSCYTCDDFCIEGQCSVDPHTMLPQCR